MENYGSWTYPGDICQDEYDLISSVHPTFRKYFEGLRTPEAMRADWDMVNGASEEKALERYCEAKMNVQIQLSNADKEMKNRVPVPYASNVHWSHHNSWSRTMEVYLAYLRSLDGPLFEDYLREMVRKEKEEENRSW